MKFQSLKINYKYLLPSIVFTVINFSSAPLLAQADEAFSLEEVVVTARKKEESLQNTPVAVTAFSGSELESKGINNLVDLSGFAPNLNIGTSGFAGAGNYSAGINIRGLGQTEFLPHLDPAVGIYIDGVYFGRAVGAAMELVDLDRVEILRGPQGTLFGKNTIGGAINLVTKKPNGSGSGFINLSLGSGSSRDTKGSYDMSLSPDLYGKFSFSARNGGEYGEAVNYATKNKIADLGGRDSVAFRAAFSWQASDATSVDFSFDNSDRSDDQSVNGLIALDPGAGAGLGGLWLGLVGIPTGQLLLPDYITGNPDKTYASTFPNDLEVSGMNLTIESDLGWSVFKSITSKRDMEAKFGRDGDIEGVDFSSTYDQQKQDQTSQEFQLSGETGKLTWIAGAFYFDESYYDHNDVAQGPGMYEVLETFPGQLAGTPCAPPWIAPGCKGNPINIALDIRLDVTNIVDVESTAFYSQVTYALTDKLNITAGLRNTDEEKTVFGNSYKIASKSYTLNNVTNVASWKETTSMLSIDYHVSDDLMTYISLSEGFKSGGFNPRPVGGFSAAPFGPEYVESTEIGFKSELLNRRLRLNGSYYFSDYKDLQFSVNRFNAITGTLELLVGNAAEAEIDGYELELEAAITESLSLKASIGSANFKITNLYPGTSPEITLNTKQALSPENTSALSLIYSAPIMSGNVKYRVDYSYQDETFADIQNTSQLKIKANDLLNARATFESSSNWEIAVFGTNLGDERVLVGGTSNYSSFGHIEATYNRPREYGVSFRLNF